MSFIKIVPNHWHPTDFDLSNVSLDASISHITKTICLLESRCDNYAEYLRAIFRDREKTWNAGIDRWNFEECQHGVILRALSESVDKEFLFKASMSKYESMVSYHEPTGESVRGSVGAEMVSRCVVEALASTLYRVLADATEDPAGRAVYSTLAKDEARHFGMFLKMLNAEAMNVRGLGFWTRCGYALRRMLELEDSQIMVASYVVAERSNASIQLRREANWYLGQLYKLYRWKHLRYATQMLLHAVGLRRVRTLTVLCTFALWLGIKMRWVCAIVCSRLASPKQAPVLLAADR